MELCQEEGGAAPLNFASPQKNASSLPLCKKHLRFRAQTNVPRSVLAHAVLRLPAAPSARCDGRAAPRRCTNDETVSAATKVAYGRRVATRAYGAAAEVPHSTSYRCGPRNSRGARPHTFTTRAAARRPQIRPRRRRRAHHAPARHQAANSAPCHGVRARRAGPGRPPTHTAPHARGAEHHSHRFRPTAGRSIDKKQVVQSTTTKTTTTTRRRCPP